MKKELITTIIILSTQVAFAQISVGLKTETVCKLQMGYYTLEANLTNADTTYFMSLNTNNRFHTMIVQLGNREEALVTMRSMYDYTDFKSKNVVKLNNPSNNTAILTKVMGALSWSIFEEYSSGNICGYLARVHLEKFIEALEAYGKNK